MHARLQELAEYFTTVAKALTEVVNPLYQTDIEDIVPGCGAVVQKGLEKVAVYKDEQGGTHAFRAVCPHLGCLVQWNPTQSTFDCPCHGSYFDKFGRVVHGPAKADLTPVELKTFGVKSVA
jgi:Rieske Fe-S protein